MRIPSLLTIAIISLLAVSITACGGKKDKETDAAVEQQNDELARAIQDGQTSRVSMLADSMANYIDDLTCDETVTLLMAFLEVHNDAVSRNDKQADLVTIRKFVDVYDIAMQLNPNDFPKAVNAARALNPNVDLPAVAIQFRDRLAEYDALQGVSEEVVDNSAKKDTATIEVVKPVSSDDKSASSSSDVPEQVKPEE